MKKINISEWAEEHVEWCNGFLKATQDSFKVIEKNIKTISVILAFGIVSTFTVAINALVIAKRN